MAYQQQFISLLSFPTAIVHIDCDAFFASVEQAMHPEYKGKPVVTGAERGIIAAASYEAKALGITRGVHLGEARRMCPGLIVLPTDYETCSLFSKRMFDIMRRFTPEVEEYSIDEGFADLKGLRRLYRKPYEDIAHDMKDEIDRELGITVSIGLSLSKGLAKLCSKFRKPNGFTAVRGRHIHILLERTTLKEIWGIGANSAALLEKHGVKNALDFAHLEEPFVRKLLGKLGVEIWNELNGRSVYPVDPEEKQTYQTITKFKTFTPTVTDRSVLKAFLLRNIESACIKVRRYHLSATKMYITLRTQSFQHLSLGTELNRASASPLELAPIAERLFDLVFRPDEYRATGVVLSDLIADDRIQMGLFDSPLEIARLEKMSSVIDETNGKFGKHTLHLASTLQAGNQHAGKRGKVTARKVQLFPGETARQRLQYPRVFMPEL